METKKQDVNQGLSSLCSLHSKTEKCWYSEEKKCLKGLGVLTNALFANIGLKKMFEISDQFKGFVLGRSVYLQRAKKCKTIQFKVM